jgi:hypothetical protein
MRVMRTQGISTKGMPSIIGTRRSSGVTTLVGTHRIWELTGATRPLETRLR